MRQKIGAKKVAKYRRETGLPICTALVRGNTNHRVDLLLEGGKIVHYWPQTGEVRQAENLSWDYNEWMNQIAPKK